MRARRLLALTVAMMVVPWPSRGQEQEPWLGTWRLNTAKSTARAEPSPYKRVTIRIERAGDGLRVTSDMVGTRGGVTHMEWTGPFDGRDYPVQGAEYVLTNAYRRIDGRRYEIVIKVDGNLAATAVASVSGDGRTLTVTTSEQAARKKPVTTTAVYDRH
jgi:hypothetical protein